MLQRVFFALILCWFTILMTSCPTYESKYTSEEAGYMEEVSPILFSASSIGLVKPVSTYCAFHGEFETEYVPIEALDKRDWSAISQELSSIIPPESLRDLHSKLLKTIETQQSFEQLDSQNFTDTGLRVKNVYITDESEKITLKKLELKALSESLRELKNNFQIEVEKRPAQNVNGDAINLTYHPPIIPLGLSYSTNGEFSIEPSPGIETPIGSFGAGIKEAKGIKKLIIRSEGKIRYFKLDRAFKLFIPTDYGVEVSSEAGEQMTIEVKKKANN